jgi:hypothetical protein
MYGGQLRSSMPCTTQDPRNRTASKSTTVTSFKSRTTFSVTPSSCFFNSRIPSGSIRPLILRIASWFSELRAILKVTLGYHGSSKCTRRAIGRRLNTRQLRTRQSGGYRHMAKFAISLRSSDEIRARRLVGGPEPRSGNNLLAKPPHGGSESRRDRFRSLDRPFRVSRRMQNEWRGKTATRELGSELETNAGV